MTLIEHCQRAAYFTQILTFCGFLALKERARLCADFARAKARWVWRHRTKTAGTLAMAAGSLQGFIEAHPMLAKHLPGSQAMLIGFGAIVTAIGAYNTAAGIFGWTDDPDPPPASPVT